MVRFTRCSAFAAAYLSVISAFAQTVVPAGSYLQAYESDTSYIVHANSYLEIRPGESPQSGKITLARGILNPTSHPSDVPVTFTGPIEVQAFGLIGRTAGSTVESFIQGPVTGWGTFGIQGSSVPHHYQGPIDFMGDLMINDRGMAIFSGPMQIAGDFLILPHPTDTESAFATWQTHAPEIAGHTIVGGGNLSVDIDTTLRQLVLDPRRRAAPSNMNANLTVAPGKSLEVSGGVDFRGGAIHGSLRFDGDLVKEMRTYGELSRLGSDFHNDIVIKSGLVNIADSAGAGSTEGVVRVASSNAAVSIAINTVVADDVYLNNSRGYRYTGALLGNNTSGGSTPELAGDLYLGETGSYVGGVEPEYVNTRSHGGPLVLSGAIHGGALNKSTRGAMLAIVGDGHTYSGNTNILGDTLALRGAGRLESTSEIVLHSTSALLPVLQFDNATSSHPDRVADSVPIKTLGGRIEILGGATETAQETLGNVHVEAGTLYLRASGQSALTIDNFSREADTTVMFVRMGNDARLHLPNATLSNGLIGGWAVLSENLGGPATDFATLGPDGVVGLASVQPYHTDAQTAGPADNLKLTAVNHAFAIPNSVHVNAVRFESSYDSTLDLQGHTLTLESGGMLSPGAVVTVQNGVVTVGAEQNLYLHQAFDIKANIVDGNAGPLSVVINDLVSLSGDNSYSGATVVNWNGRATLASRDALPADSDLVINGGRYRTIVQDGMPLEFNKISLRSGVIDYQSHPSLVPLVATEYEVFDGEILLPLGGSGTFYKRGEGVASLTWDANTFTGQIIVEQGTLEAPSGGLGGGFPSIANATIVREGGILVPRGNHQEYVVLEGGTIAGSTQGSERFEGPIDVRAASRIETARRTVSFAISGPIIGSGDLTIEGGLSHAGGSVLLRSNLNQYLGNIELTGGSIVMDMPNINYGGAIAVDAYELTLGHHDALGRGVTTVLPGGAIAFQDFTTPLNSKLNVQGTLRLREQTTTINGEIRFEGRPDIDGFGEFIDPNFAPFLQVNAPSTFADETRLISRGRTTISLAGDVILEGNVELVAFDGHINIVNKVVAAAANSSLNLIGHQPDTNLGSVEILPGAGFSLYHNSAPVLTQFQSASARVAGSGTMGTPVSVGNNATISPGASIGELHFADSLTLLSNANYEWEISDALGQPGQANGWDHLLVDGLLNIIAGAQQNFINIRIVGLNAEGEIGQIANFNPLQDYSWPIISVANVDGFSPDKFQFNLDGFATNNPFPEGAKFRVELGNDGLALVYQVPAPPALLLSAQAGLLIVATLRRQAKRKLGRC